MSRTKSLPYLVRYEIDGLLGRGAMSVVYRARDRRDGTVAAIKLIRSELLAGDERRVVLSRFKREADIGLTLDHPRIVKVFDYGDTEGTPYLAMELIAGRELKDYLAATPPLPLERKVALIDQVLDALGYVHGKGIVHRDVKPANAVVTDDFRLKLMDFGIAREGNSELTYVGEMMGTPAYMSPEQLRGELADARSDLFAAGITCYYLLTGVRPFNGTIATIMQQIILHDPMPPSAANPLVPEAFDCVLRTALAKDREQRFQTAEAFRDALSEAVREAARSPFAVVATAAEQAESTFLSLASLDSLIGELRVILVPEIGEARFERLGSALRALRGTDWGSRTLPGALVIACLDDGMKPLADIIWRSAPFPGRDPALQRGDWIGGVALLMRLRDIVANVGEAAAARAVVETLSAELTEAFGLYAQRLEAALSIEDNPDVATLSVDFCRLDVVEVAIGDLGSADDRARVREEMAGFASQVMQKVNAVVRLYTETGDRLARYGVAILLSYIEDLIAIAARPLEDKSKGVVSLSGEDVMAEFISHAHTLAGLIHGELDADLDQLSADEKMFDGLIKQLGALYEFARNLPGDNCRPLLAALTADVHRHMKRIAIRLSDVVSREPTPYAVNRLISVYELADRIGWEEIRRVVLGVLRSVITQGRR